MPSRHGVRNARVVDCGYAYMSAETALIATRYRILARVTIAQKKATGGYRSPEGIVSARQRHSEPAGLEQAPADRDDQLTRGATQGGSFLPPL